MPLERGVRRHYALTVSLALTGIILSLTAFVAGPDYPAGESAWRPWYLLFAGLIITGLVVAYLLTNARYVRSLSAVNSQLREEVVERTRIEHALRDSEEHYRSLFDNMLNGLAYCKMIFDGEVPTDFTYINVNGAFERLTGLKDVEGKRVSEVIPGIRESNPELFEVYGRVAYTAIPEHFEAWVEPLAQWFSVSVYSPGEEYFVAVFDVITERKRAEEAVRKSEATLKSVLSASPVGIALCRDDRTIDWINDRLISMMGYPFDEIRGMVPDFLYVSHDEFLRIGKELYGSIRAGNVGTAETTWIRKDGALRNIDLSGALIDPGDMSAGVVFTAM
ncbi:MAG TPA: PAS domain S-box protein, partial [Syntrophorhabdales bacterium]|nr:PAS domain S-box protein [Syntrophorhabdales bacterium]